MTMIKRSIPPPTPPQKSAIDEVNAFVDSLDSLLAKYPFAQKIKAQAGVRPAYVVIAIATLVLLFVLFGIGAHAVCNLTGFAYPIYASFKALKTPGKGDDTQWLTYWIVYGFFSFIESFTDILMRWIPFYYVFKVAFLIYCYLPQTLGANKIYNAFLHPYFVKYERKIDKAIAEGEEFVERVEAQIEGQPQPAATKKVL